ncbi:hypothetical protein AMATHDRAFT_48254 [Amanita thiersii Skay4041]|uniref:Uncharacterized protein n=1 Tax=Amanita thiersii Skay4041 TaxID=703135 RepID=A0A2A9NNT4_9AGAR|nr:hypothetical protein AMATHDRAFT_48254 [Amanita thiersii Skay4041]
MTKVTIEELWTRENFVSGLKRGNQPQHYTPQHVPHQKLEIQWNSWDILSSRKDKPTKPNAKLYPRVNELCRIVMDRKMVVPSPFKRGDVVTIVDILSANSTPFKSRQSIAYNTSLRETNQIVNTAIYVVTTMKQIVDTYIVDKWVPATELQLIPMSTVL